MDWSSDPWAPKPKLKGLSEIAGTRLPVPLTESVQRNPHEELTIDSSDSDFLSALGELTRLVDEAKAVKDVLRSQSDTARRIRDNARAAYDHAKQYADAADNAFRNYGGKVIEFEADLRRIRQLYTDRQTRQTQLTSIADELAFYEKIASEKEWGKHMLKHQKAGAFQMAFEKRCILADQMGLGKTLQAIIAMDLRQAKKVLILAPNDVLSNFAREITYWTTDSEGNPTRNVMALGTIKNKFMKHEILKSLKGLPEFTVLLNYEAWRTDKEIIRLLTELEFEMVILDEAHNLKDPNSGFAQGVKKIVYAENVPYCCERCGYKFTRWPYSNMCSNCAGPIERVPFARNSVKCVYPMTGTAILNSPEELWMLLNLLDNLAFANQTEFLRHYCRQVEVLSLTGKTYVKKWVFGPGGEDMLFRKLGAKIIRRTRKTAEIEIPPQGEQIHTLEFDEVSYLAQQKVYHDMKTYGQTFMVNKEILSARNVVTIINRLRQAITMPSGIQMKDPISGALITTGVTESIKVDCAVGLAQEFVQMNDERVVVFSQFKEPLRVLADRLEELGIRVARYFPEQKPEVLDEMARDFDAKFTKNGEHKYDVIVGTFDKLGKGLNLVLATQTICIDEEWTPGLNEQAYDRTNRIGQTKETTRHIIRVAGTIDIPMARLIEFKKGITGGFESKVEQISPLDVLEDALSGE